MAKLKAPLATDYLAKPYESHEEPLSKLELANQLTSLYGQLEHATVAVLNGRWGSGKSTFSRKLVHHLSASGISVTYFDAFAKDFSDSPFLALSAHLITEIEDRGNKSLPSAKTIKRNAKVVSTKLASVSAKVLVKAVTLGLVGASEIDELTKIADDIGGATGDLAEEASSALFESYLSSESEFERFRVSLDGLAEALESKNDIDPDDSRGIQRKAVFIIDELDRCRPDFALGILEVIKHLFGNDNVHFLLVTNIEYLVASVNSRYGLGEASAEYLEKFYDFVIFFEDSANHEYRHAAATLVKDRLNALLDSRKNTQGVHDLSEALQAFARGFDLSLRQASALATNAALSYLVYRQNTFRPAVLIALLSLYRMKFPRVYQDIKKRTYTMAQLLAVFEGVQIKDERYMEWLRRIIEFYAATDSEIDRDDDKYSGFGQMGLQYDFGSYRDVFPFLANAVVDNFGG